MSRPVLLIDFGGVLVRDKDPSTLVEWQQRLGLDHQTVPAAIFENEMSRSAMKGQLPADALFSALAAHLRLSVQQTQELWDTFWQSQELNDPLIEYLQSLRPRIDLAICSNFWPNYEEVMFGRYGLERLTSRFFVSCQLKCMKPFAGFFETVKDSCAPENRLALVDDAHWNVSGAERSSIRGIHHSMNDLTIEQIDHWLSSL